MPNTTVRKYDANTNTSDTPVNILVLVFFIRLQWDPDPKLCQSENVGYGSVPKWSGSATLDIIFIITDPSQNGLDLQHWTSYSSSIFKRRNTCTLVRQYQYIRHVVYTALYRYCVKNITVQSHVRHLICRYFLLVPVDAVNMYSTIFCG
jgi:hypothetical protein